jgi:histidine triad (HIT) family protein
MSAKPHSAYDTSNIFAKILRGEMPAQKVYEDAETMVIMDIMPRADGHCLVIPKGAARNMLDASPEQLAACIKTVQKVSKAAMAAFAADGISIQQANETAGNQLVFHLHYHVLPRHLGQALKSHTGQMEKPDVLATNADKLRAALKTL